MPPITMIIEAISLVALLSKRLDPPTVTCHPGTVSYRFVGAPGTMFTYMGETWTVPKKGSIELIGHGGDREYRIEGKTLPLEVWPINEFGTRTVQMPVAE
jgi:hypothetical protein